MQGFADTSKHEVFWKYRRKGRQDVPVGDVYLTDFNWELLTVSYQTLVYRGYYNGDHSWSLSYTEPDGTVETFLFLCKSLSTGKWTFFQNSFSLPADLSEVHPDESWEIKGEYSGDIIGTSSADWGAGFSFSSLNPGSGWDYRRYEHDWILAYNYKEKRWSTRAAHGMVSLYSNPYAIQAFRVIDEFNENWTEGGLFEAPVYADEYPWADIVFATQERVSGTTVLVTTTEAHNLQSGLLVNVVNSVPTNFNAKDVEITAINANTFSYPSVGSNGNATTIGTILGRRIDGSWQYSNFPSVALVGRKGNLAVYEGGEFEDENGNSIFSEVTTHELFFGSIMDTKEPSEVKLVYKGVGNPRVTLQVGYRDHQMEDMRWTEEAEPLVLSIEGELRYNLQFSLRSKFFTFKIKAYNTATDYVQEFLGGSLFISGMLNKGTEL
ncbi:MAG: hypothetical protein HC840_01215 [Leptolyngbyaceae cyanobacterium RM2_2_4]|nr:hypothetical protein [Leptolyngbyaceae cyanobacterium RM2_2_4]